MPLVALLEVDFLPAPDPSGRNHGWGALNTIDRAGGRARVMLIAGGVHRSDPPSPAIPA